MTALHPSLIRLIERIIQTPVEGFSSAIFPGPDADWPRQGRYFSLQKDGAQAIIYPWFGVYDTAFGPVIYIGFNGNSSWCQPVYQPALAWGLTEGRTYRRPYEDMLRKELCFALKEEQLNRFKATGSAESQEKILSEFFAEVIGHIGRFF
jgi:hypothetical protein